MGPGRTGLPMVTFAACEVALSRRARTRVPAAIGRIRISGLTRRVQGAAPKAAPIQTFYRGEVKATRSWHSTYQRASSVETFVGAPAPEEREPASQAASEKSGRQDLNLRPLGPQPAQSTALRVRARPRPPPRPPLTNSQDRSDNASATTSGTKRGIHQKARDGAGL